VLGAGPGEHVDHVNGWPCDNRRHNLRKCTPTENARNIGRPITNTSGYKGVSWRQNMARWVAMIWANGKQRLIGFYLTKEEAALAYNEIAGQLHGKFARLNEVRSIPPTLAVQGEDIVVTRAAAILAAHGINVLRERPRRQHPRRYLRSLGAAGIESVGDGERQGVAVRARP
jgi:hypothetical protein